MGQDQAFRVMAVQFCGRYGRFAENCGRIRLWVRRGSRRQCDLVLFPELSLTGYCTGKAKIRRTAQPIPGPGSDFLLALAQEHHLAVSAGITEKSGRRFFLCQVTALPDGRLHVYRKRFGLEKGFSMGGGAAPFQYGNLRIGVVICMDARIYELYRDYAFQGTHLLMKPNAAWAGPWEEGPGRDVPRAVRDHRRLMRLDWEKDSHFAASNGMAMICCNTVGETGYGVYPGGCWFSDGTAGIRKSIALCCRRADLRERSIIGELDVRRLKARSPAIRRDLRMAAATMPWVSP